MNKVKEKKKTGSHKDFDSILEFLFDESGFASMQKIKAFQEKREKKLKTGKQWFFAQ